MDGSGSLLVALDHYGSLGSRVWYYRFDREGKPFLIRAL